MEREMKKWRVAAFGIDRKRDHRFICSLGGAIIYVLGKI